MSDPQNQEDRILEAVLDRLEAVNPLAESEAAGAEEQTLERLYLELLGLLPYSLIPETPSAGARQNLMAAVGVAAPVITAPATQDAPLSFSKQPGTATTRNDRDDPAASNREDWGEVVALPSQVTEKPRPTRRFGGRWLVAASTLIALGASGAAGWFFGQLQTSQQEIAGREAAIGLMASRGAEVCPLRPTADASETNNQQAFAVLFMHPKADTWFLRASNLAPLTEGQQYRIWFETDQGPVAAGALEAGPASEIEIASNRIGSRMMHGVTVTVEAASASISQPSGRPILHGTAAEMFVL